MVTVSEMGSDVETGAAEASHLTTERGDLLSSDIKVIRTSDSDNKEGFVIEHSKNSKVTIDITIDENDEGWVFGRGTVTSVDMDAKKVRLADATVSSKHFKILRQGGSLYIIDLGSLHGTKVNGKSIAGNEQIKVKRGVCILVGKTKIRLSAERPSAVFNDDDFGDMGKFEPGFACPICQEALMSLTPDERGKHILKCVEKSKDNRTNEILDEAPRAEILACPFCQANLSTLKDKEKQSHIDSCERTDDNKDCPLCGKQLAHLTQIQREAHANRCADILNPSSKKRKPKIDKTKTAPLTSSRSSSKNVAKSSTTSNVSAAELVVGHDTGKKKEKEGMKRFTFTKTTSSLPDVVDVERDFVSDDNVFEESDPVLVKKKCLESESKALMTEEVIESYFQAKHKVEEIENKEADYRKRLHKMTVSSPHKTSTTAEPHHVNANEDRELKRLFPDPFLPTLPLSRDWIVRKKLHLEKQLLLMNELLALVGNNENEKSLAATGEAVVDRKVSVDSVDVEKLLIPRSIEVRDVADPKDARESISDLQPGLADPIPIVNLSDDLIKQNDDIATKQVEADDIEMTSSETSVSSATPGEDAKVTTHVTPKENTTKDANCGTDGVDESNVAPRGPDDSPASVKEQSYVNNESPGGADNITTDANILGQQQQFSRTADEGHLCDLLEKQNSTCWNEDGCHQRQNGVADSVGIPAIGNAETLAEDRIKNNVVKVSMQEMLRESSHNLSGLADHTENRDSCSVRPEISSEDDVSDMKENSCNHVAAVSHLNDLKPILQPHPRLWLALRLQQAPK